MHHRKIIVGITGSIAAYKSAELVRLLIQRGVEVRVVMTRSALEFIRPLTFEALTGHKVGVDVFENNFSTAMDHIVLVKWADAIVIAPATANIISKIASGIADDLLSTICLATTATIYVAPAMNQAMWQHQATQHNVALLQQRGVILCPPETGEQACGDMGPGRMLSPEVLMEQLFPTSQKFLDKKIIITAGPTIEAIDPVRYISNHSSGKMGYALAQAAIDSGAEVILISGSTHLSPPLQATFIAVKTAMEMYNQVMLQIKHVDIYIGAAAIADYRSEKVREEKIKKESDQEFFDIRLVKNPDILSAITSLDFPPLTIGFSAETENLLENSRKKLVNKKLDMIVANFVGEQRGFYQDDNQVTLLMKDGDVIDLSLKNKKLLAREILNVVVKKLIV